MVCGYAKLCLCLLNVPEVEMSTSDAMSQAPRALLTPELEAVVWTDFTTSSSRTAALGVRRVVDEVKERRAIFDGCHNIIQGHHEIQRTVNDIRVLEYDWARMTRDVTGWIAECPSCQKARAKDPGVVVVPSAIGSVCIFEKISVDYIQQE